MTAKRPKLHPLIRLAPKMLLAILLVFTFAAVVAGELFGAYDIFWWWDDMLHGTSGVIFGLVGFLLAYFINGRYHLAVGPLFMAVFAFTFAMTIGVLWEIFEFSVDVIFGAAMQQWNLPDDARLMGRVFQGSGLRDTMSDLILASGGALFAAIFSYLAYKNDRQTVLSVMRQLFPMIRRKKRTVRTK